MGFEYRNGSLHAERVALDEIALRHGTPCYVYSRGAIETACREYRDAPAGRPAPIAFSVRANPNLAVPRGIGRAGRGLDAVSGAHRGLPSSPPRRSAGLILGKGGERVDTPLEGGRDVATRQGFARLCALTQSVEDVALGEVGLGADAVEIPLRRGWEVVGPSGLSEVGRAHV